MNNSIIRKISKIFLGSRIETVFMTKFTTSWEPSDVSFQSNKDLKIWGDHFTPPPYQTRVKVGEWIVGNG